MLLYHWPLVYHTVDRVHLIVQHRGEGDARVAAGGGGRWWRRAGPGVSAACCNVLSNARDCICHPPQMECRQGGGGVEAMQRLHTCQVQPIQDSSVSHWRSFTAFSLPVLRFRRPAAPPPAAWPGGLEGRAVSQRRKGLGTRQRGQPAGLAPIQACTPRQLVPANHTVQPARPEGFEDGRPCWAASGRGL